MEKPGAEVKGSFFTTIKHAFGPLQTEDVTCNLCAASEYHELGQELSFQIRECARCHLVYINPQPTREELPRFYEGMYSDDSPQEVASRSLGRIEPHLSRLIAHRRPKGGRLLEVGCGFGRLLKTLSQQPWQLHALELNPTAAAYARRQTPTADIQISGVEDAVVAPSSMDCLVAIAVLEHVKDPRAVLQRFTNWLAPGGLLMVQVPYIAAYIRLKRWIPFLPICFEAPRHLFDFSPKTLTRYLTELGYKDIRLEVARPYSAKSALGAWLIHGVKLPGYLLHRLSGGRYIYPFAGAFVIHAVADKKSSEAT